MLLKSKKVKHGTVVRYHGKKLVRAGQNSRNIAGVYNGYSERIILTELTEEVQQIIIPAGLVMSGTAEALIR